MGRMVYCRAPVRVGAGTEEWKGVLQLLCGSASAACGGRLTFASCSVPPIHSRYLAGAAAAPQTAYPQSDFQV